MARLTLRDAGWGFLGERRRGLGDPGLRDRRFSPNYQPEPTMTIAEIISTTVLIRTMVLMALGMALAVGWLEL